MLQAWTNEDFICLGSCRQSHVIQIMTVVPAENCLSDTEFEIFNLEENRAKGV